MINIKKITKFGQQQLNQTKEEEMKKENQYTVVAKEAYFNIIEKKMSFQQAWEEAAQKNISSKESQKKQCPMHTFLGFCESGDLHGINGTQKSDNINYQYAKFALAEWKKDRTISGVDMWKKVYEKFKRAAGHQGQLDVAKGLIQYIK